jgi:hypothetical protein
MGRQDSAISTATGYRLYDWGVGVEVLVGARIFVQTGSGTHSTSKLMGTRGSFPSGKALRV